MWKFSPDVRNAIVDAVEVTIGESPILRIYEGAEPDDTEEATTGTLLAEMELPADWLSDAANGVKTQLGTWSDADGGNTGGTMGYFRLFETTGTDVQAQGDITATGGGGDLTFSSVTIAEGQDIELTGVTLTALGA